MKKSLRGNLQALLPRVHLLRCRNIKWAKGECVLNQIVFAAGVLLFPAVCTTLGAAGVFLLRRSAAPRTQRVLSGMAAGIMLAASVWSLLLPAIERTRELGVAAWVPPSAGLVLGAAGLLRLESMAGQLLQQGKISAPGWDDTFKVSYELRLNDAGQLLQVTDLRASVAKGKKTVLAPRELRVPKHEKRTVGIIANLLCDNSTYLLGADEKGKPARSVGCFKACAALHHTILDGADSPAARAVLT